jgi:hypothetical protein
MLRIRRIARRLCWLFTGLSLCSLALTLFSGLYWCGFRTREYKGAIVSGAAWVQREPLADDVRVLKFITIERHDAGFGAGQWRSLPSVLWNVPLPVASVPLWIPTAFFGLLAAIAGLFAFRKPAPGMCAACGYNLTGNTSGLCPECGAVAAADTT